MEKQLRRNPREGALAGVCAGLGEYLDINRIWVRLFFIASIFFHIPGVGLMGAVAYIVLWIVLPEKPLAFPYNPLSADYEAAPSESASWPIVPPARKSNDRQVAGIILLGIGIIFLLHQFKFIWWDQLIKFWPVIIIALGLLTIWRAFASMAVGPKNEKDKTYTK